MTAQRSPIRVVSLFVVAVTLPLLAFAAAAGAQTTGTSVDEPDSFTSMFSVSADADQVPTADDGTQGEPGATGTFDLRIASGEEIVCHDITLTGVTPPFESPAPTATHIHDGPAGVVGPAVWLFPNPEMAADGTLQSSGCLQNAFSGDAVEAEFSLTEIEATPTDYYVDNHTSAYVPGSVRGQFTASMPSGGVATGAGGTADDGTTTIMIAALLATMLAGIGLASQTLARRRAHAGARRSLPRGGTCRLRRRRRGDDAVGSDDSERPTRVGTPGTSRSRSGQLAAGHPGAGY